jgi:hypothetical protein
MLCISHGQYKLLAFATLCGSDSSFLALPNPLRALGCLAPSPCPFCNMLVMRAVCLQHLVLACNPILKPFPGAAAMLAIVWCTVSLSTGELAVRRVQLQLGYCIFLCWDM